MNGRLLIALIICASALTACYRQAEEEIQQVDSSEVVLVITPLPAVTTDPASASEGLQPPDAVSEDAEPTQSSGFITPQPPPGQVQQPTIVLPTRVELIAASTPGESATRSFTLPTPTQSFEDSLSETDECVYSVLPGDNLFRLSIQFGTTVEAFFEENNLDNDALQIGQLLLVPGCERAATAEPPTRAPGPVIETAEEATATDVPAEPTPMTPAGPRIHVVSAGESVVSIALNYEVGADAIREANDLPSDSEPSIGQELVIPEVDFDEG